MALKKASAVKSRRLGREFAAEVWTDIRNSGRVDLMKGAWPSSIGAKQAKLERADPEEFNKAAKAEFKDFQREWLRYDYVG